MADGVARSRPSSAVERPSPLRRALNIVARSSYKNTPKEAAPAGKPLKDMNVQPPSSQAQESVRVKLPSPTRGKPLPMEAYAKAAGGQAPARLADGKDAEPIVDPDALIANELASRQAAPHEPVKALAASAIARADLGVAHPRLTTKHAQTIADYLVVFLEKDRRTHMPAQEFDELFSRCLAHTMNFRRAGLDNPRALWSAVFQVVVHDWHPVDRK